MTLAFGIFKSRVFAEVLFGISECDAQLELQERHYVKIRKKSNYWIAFLVIMLGKFANSYRGWVSEVKGKYRQFFFLSKTMSWVKLRYEILSINKTFIDPLLLRSILIMDGP